jgi:hypothetical protein
LEQHFQCGLFHLQGVLDRRLCESGAKMSDASRDSYAFESTAIRPIRPALFRIISGLHLHFDRRHPSLAGVTFITSRKIA